MINNIFNKRNILFLIQSKHFNLTLGYITLILVLLLGVLPLILSIYNNYILSRDLISYITTSQQKIDFLVESDEFLNQSIESYGYFNYYMPKNPNLSNYLLDIDQLITSSGFFTEDVSTIVNNSTKTVTIEITLYGYGNLVDLVKKIESQKRITTVKNIRFIKVKNRMLSNLTLEIYFRWI